MMNFTVKGHNIPLSTDVNLGVQVSDLADLEALVKFLTEQGHGAQVSVDMMNKVITIGANTAREDEPVWCDNCCGCCDCEYDCDNYNEDWEEDYYDEDEDEDDEDDYDDEDDDEDDEELPSLGMMLDLIRRMSL